MITYMSLNQSALWHRSRFRKTSDQFTTLFVKVFIIIEILIERSTHSSRKRDDKFSIVSSFRFLKTLTTTIYLCSLEFFFMTCQIKHLLTIERLWWELFFLVNSQIHFRLHILENYISIFFYDLSNSISVHKHEIHYIFLSISMSKILIIRIYDLSTFLSLSNLVHNQLDWTTETKFDLNIHNSTRQSDAWTYCCALFKIMSFISWSDIKNSKIQSRFPF